MQYWATVALTPQAPNLAVTNDATAFEDAFIAAVYASLSLVETVPPFKTLIDNVEAVAKGVTWTVTPPPPLPPFTSGIN